MGTSADRRAVRAGDAAASAVGGGGADDIVQGCALIRTGVFLDGTANYRGNVGQPEASWHTNVDLLQEIYREQLEDDVEMTFPNGETRIAKTFSAYHAGIGIESGTHPDHPAGEANAFPGQALGTGRTGVDTRVNEAVARLNQDIRQNSGGTRPCDIWIDVFGFSRGAVAARDFANHVRAGDIDGGGARVRTKYLGLFDTVSSVAWPGEMDGTYWVDLRTPGRAETIVHITADDEIRANFPLTLASGRRIAMAGTHGDIGGSWPPRRVGGSFRWQTVRSNDGFTNRVANDWGVTVDGPPTSGGERLMSEGDVAVAGMGVAVPITYLTFDWQAEPGLQFVSLRLMYHFATRAGVPFEAFETIPHGAPAVWNEELQAYYVALRDNPSSISQAWHTRIRRKYVHFSVNDAMGGPFPINHPEWDGQRNSASM